MNIGMKKFRRKSRVFVPIPNKSDWRIRLENDNGEVPINKFLVRSRVKVPDIGISPFTQKLLKENWENIEKIKDMQRKSWICRLLCK